jgi:hypothetical protein
MASGPGGFADPATGRCSPPKERLPDLRQELPSDLTVDLQRIGRRIVFRLGFTSAIANVGDGPLRLIGRRAAGTREMRAEQIVERVHGGVCRYPDVGVIRFDFNHTHDHWHLQRFDRYSLTDLRGRHPVAPVRKAGFCLNDDAWVRGARGTRVQRTFLSDCGLGEPRARSVTEGISVGWSDVYLAYVEGQYIDITKVAPGRYVLSNQVNVGHPLAETRLGNDAASLLIRLSWPHGRRQFPALRILATCPHEKTCHLPRR